MPALWPPRYYGWTILGVAIVAVFISSPGQTYVISVFIDPIQRDTGWSRTLVSGLYTAGSLTAAAGMFVVGRLMDRFGSRATLTMVSLLFGAAALWMSQVSQPFHLYVGFVFLRLLGQGSLTVVPTAMVALWFVRLRGRALSLTSLGAVAGQAAFPPLVYLLIAHMGWRTAWVVLAVVIWVVLVPPAFLLVRRTPESMGLLPDGDARPAGARADGPDPAWPGDDDWTLEDALRTRPFWLLMLAGSSQSLISTALTFHHVSFMTSLGLDPAMAATVFMMVAVCSLAGTFVVGVLSDRFAPRYLVAAGQVILMSAMLWSFTVSAPWQALVYGGLLGAASGFSLALTIVWANYFGRLNLGAIRSVAATSMIASAAVGPLPFGWMFDLTGSYRLPILVFLTLPAISALAAIAATPPRR